jgi:hypothetical protein
MDATDRSYHKQPIFQNTKATSTYRNRWIRRRIGLGKGKRGLGQETKVLEAARSGPVGRRAGQAVTAMTAAAEGDWDAARIRGTSARHASKRKTDLCLLQNSHQEGQQPNQAMVQGCRFGLQDPC